MGHKSNTLTDGVDLGQHRRGKRRHLRPFLLPALQLVHLVRVPQRPLDHGHVHLLDDLLGGLLGRRTVAAQQLEVPHGEEVKEVVVELGHAGEVGALDAAGLEVLAPLVGELVEEVARGDPILSFQRAGVEALWW